MSTDTPPAPDGKSATKLPKPLKKRSPVKSDRRRRTSAFPAVPFENALELPRAIFKLGAGQPVRRLSLFDSIDKSPDSGPSRQLVTNSTKYGLTTGSYGAEHLSLTPEGRQVIDPETPLSTAFRVKSALAIERIPPFKKLYDQYAGNKMPAPIVMRDFIVGDDVPEEDGDECIAMFIVNLRYAGLLQTIAGADRVLTIEHALEEVLKGTPAGAAEDRKPSALTISPAPSRPIVQVKEDFSSTCFYITGIGEENSDVRRHADLFLNSLVEPALQGFGLKVVRADKIEKSGMISRHIVDHVLRSKLVIADLSFHNPNVFYELALRHAARLPTVQLIRGRDNIPFDLANYRTIKIDDTNLYTFVPKIEAYRAEILTHVRTALEDPDAVDNPIVAYAPGIKLTF